MFTKKSVVLFLFSLCTNLVFGQDYAGINFSRFFPLQNINNQPADLIRSNYRWHINVFSAQSAMINNFVFNESDIIKVLTKAGAKDLKYYLATDKSLLFVGDRVMLPSLSYKINHKHAVAISTNIRADGIYKSSNADFLNIFRGFKNPELLETLKYEHFKSMLNSWLEFNISWSGILFERENNLLTGGINLKYLSSGGAGYFDMDGIEISFDRDKIEYFKTSISYAVNSKFGKAINDGEINLLSDVGIGMDLGISYSHKPTYMQELQNMPYKFKIGLLIKDIGKIKHNKNIQQSTYNLEIEDIRYSSFKGIKDISLLIDTLKSLVTIDEYTNGSFNAQLPTTIVLTGDYCFGPSWYVSGLASFQMVNYFKSVKRLNQKSIKFNVTPRFENQKWGVFLPIGYDNRFKWTAGLAAHWRFLYVGSSTVIGNLFTSEKGQGEIFLGINIPLGTTD